MKSRKVFASLLIATVFLTSLYVAYYAGATNGATTLERGSFEKAQSFIVLKEGSLFKSFYGSGALLTSDLNAGPVLDTTLETAPPGSSITLKGDVDYDISTTTLNLSKPGVTLQGEGCYYNHSSTPKRPDGTCLTTSSNIDMIKINASYLQDITIKNLGFYHSGSSGWAVNIVGRDPGTNYHTVWYPRFENLEIKAPSGIKIDTSCGPILDKVYIVVTGENGIGLGFYSTTDYWSGNLVANLLGVTASAGVAYDALIKLDGNPMGGGGVNYCSFIESVAYGGQSDRYRLKILNVSEGNWGGPINFWGGSWENVDKILIEGTCANINFWGMTVGGPVEIAENGVSVNFDRCRFTENITRTGWGYVTITHSSLVSTAYINGYGSNFECDDVMNWETKAFGTVEASNGDWIDYGLGYGFRMGIPETVIPCVQESDARYICQVNDKNSTHFQLYLWDDTAGALEDVDKTISFYAKHS